MTGAGEKEPTDLWIIEEAFALPSERLEWLVAKMGFDVHACLLEYRELLTTGGHTALREGGAALVRLVLERGQRITAEDASEARERSAHFARLRAESARGRGK